MSLLQIIIVVIWTNLILILGYNKIIDISSDKNISGDDREGCITGVIIIMVTNLVIMFISIKEYNDVI